jgi:hypothetical protein
MPDREVMTRCGTRHLVMIVEQVCLISQVTATHKIPNYLGLTVRGAAVGHVREVDQDEAMNRAKLP